MHLDGLVDRGRSCLGLVQCDVWKHRTDAIVRDAGQLPNGRLGHVPRGQSALLSRGVRHLRDGSRVLPAQAARALIPHALVDQLLP